MPLIAPKSIQRTSDPVPSGNHVARCYQIIQIGTLPTEIKGETKYLHKIRFSFELPNETKEFKEGDGEKPYVISQDYTFSMAPTSNLRKVINSWRGKDLTDDEAENFDIEKLLGKGCMLNVTHKEGKNGNVYAQISSIAQLPKGTVVPPETNTFVILTFDEWNEAVYRDLPDFLKEKIASTPEYQSLRSAQNKRPLDDVLHSDEEITIDDIPF